MATLKQLREIFAPVLAEHPDLVLHRRWLFRPPIETAIIGLYIGRTSSASDSRMALSVLPLSRFREPSALGFYDIFEVERVIGVPPPNRLISDEEEGPPRIFHDMFAPDYQAHLLRNFNAKVPSFLDTVRTFDDVVAWLQPFREPSLRMEAIEFIDGWIAAMQGDFALAADQLQIYFDRMSIIPDLKDSAEYRQQEAIRDVLRTGDRTAIASCLHTMEERTIDAFGLQRFWRRAPFPFERA